MIKKLSVIKFILAIANMTIIVILAITGMKLEWIITTIIAGQAILVITVFLTIIKKIGIPLPQFERLKQYLKFSIPLIPFGILLWVINASDRYLIAHFLDIVYSDIFLNLFKMCFSEKENMKDYLTE